MKKHITTIVCIIALSVFFHTCKKDDLGIITGTVTDSVTHKPLAGVNVGILLNNATVNNVDTKDLLRNVESLQKADQFLQTVKTGADGTYTLDGVGLGDNTITFSQDGYNTQTRKTFVVAGRGYTINTSLGKGKLQIKTGFVTIIGEGLATITGSIINIGSDEVTQYGHCWSNSVTAPTITNNIGKTSKGKAEKAIDFTSSLNGLVKNAKYYVRAYAINKTGVIYGQTVAFIAGDLLFANYMFSGNYVDSAGYNMELWSPFSRGALTQDRFGDNNSALSCSNGKYTYSYDFQFAPYQQFAISFWFKKSSWTGVNLPFICMGYPSYKNEIRIGEDAAPNNIYFDIRNNASGSFNKIASNNYPSVNEWHYLVAQKTSSQIELYIDGELQASASCDSQPINTTDIYGNYFFIGFDAVPGPWPYNTASFDDVRFYGRSLSTSEINYLSTH